MRAALFLCGILAILSVASGEVKQLTGANDAIYFSKSTEIAVMGMFTAASGPEYELFMQIAKEFEQMGGVAVGFTTEKSVYSRYLPEDGGKPPSVIAFSSFNPETGEIQKGKKARLHFQGKFTYAELHTFFLVESQPVLLRLPQNLGPDFQKRMIIAFESTMPKLMIFGKAGTPASDEIVKAALTLRNKALCFFFSVDPSDSEDEGAMHMQQMGLDTKDLSKGAVASFYFKGAPERVEWDGASGQQLEASVKELLDGVEPYQPTPPAGSKGKSSGGKKKASPKGSKKKSAKSEM